MAIIPNFFLGKIGQENVFYDILERKNAFLGCKNKKFKKSKNRHFSKVLMVLIQKGPFFQQFFFLGNIGQESVCYGIRERENAFLVYKDKNFKKLKIVIFQKPQPKPQVNTCGFGPKIDIISSFFFLGNISQENVFYDILERKNAFLGSKNKKFKKTKT